MWKFISEPEFILKKINEDKIAEFLKSPNFSNNEKLVIAAALNNGWDFVKETLLPDKYNQLAPCSLILTKVIYEASGYNRLIQKENGEIEKVPVSKIDLL